MAELILLKHQRAGHRGYVNNLIKKIGEIIGDEYAELHDNKAKLLAFKDTLRQKSTTLQKIHEDMLMKGGDDSKFIEEEIASVGDFELTIQECINKIEGWICSRDEGRHTYSSKEKSGSSAVRLPKLKLKTFNGDQLEWQMFWDTFESTVDKNSDLDDVMKFGYLKSVLEGPAADIVKRFYWVVCY